MPGSVGAPIALACVALALALAARGQEPDATPHATVAVSAERPTGRFSGLDFANISCEAAYAATAGPQAEAAFAWVRVTRGLSYLRCVHWLGDGVPQRTPDLPSGCRVVPGTRPETYNWGQLEEVLDTLVQAGVAPVICFAGLPDSLLEGNPRRNETGAAANPPRDLPRFRDLVTQTLRRLIRTYGAEEVRSWYFEVWNQPDHAGSWLGARPLPSPGPPPEEHVRGFLRLWDEFAAGAAAADARLRIGGPAIAGDLEFLRRFLAHVSREGALRPSFISWHQYGEPEVVLARNREIRRLVREEFPALAGARLLVTESGLGPSAGARADEHGEAARWLGLVEASTGAEPGADMLFRAGDLVDDHLQGYRPLATLMGRRVVPMPAFRAFMLLSRMGAERVMAEGDRSVGVLATRTSPRAPGAVQVLLFRHERGDAAAGPVQVTLRVSGLPPALLRIPMRQYLLGPESHGVREAWVKAGSPRPAPADLADRLIGPDALPPQLEDPAWKVEQGQAVVPVTLPAAGVALVTLGAEPVVDVALSRRGERLRRAEAEMARARELQERGALEQSAHRYRAVAQRYGDTRWRDAALRALLSLYDSALRSPAEAEAVRRELLTTPLDGGDRVALLTRLRADALRRNEQTAVADLAEQLRALEERLRRLREWPLRRYRGE